MRSKQEKEPFASGDSIRTSSPGGGGFGDALERDLAAVERDLNRGYISRETAEADYGVVIAEAKLFVIAIDDPHTKQGEEGETRADQHGNPERCKDETEEAKWLAIPD